MALPHLLAGFIQAKSAFSNVRRVCGGEYSAFHSRHLRKDLSKAGGGLFHIWVSDVFSPVGTADALVIGAVRAH